MATPTPTTSPSDADRSAGAATNKCKSYSVSVELVTGYVSQDGSYTKACRISFEHPVEGRRPEQIRLEWEWEKYRDDTDWEYNNAVSMAINAAKAIVTFNGTPEEGDGTTQVVLLTDTCPTNVRVLSTYPLCL
ncbi:hypothetical protein NDN08_004889 [Rhodosorus marinus]|uniref:Uncharacterized protein n=1 Tax=Rhodosorus marinus TaxID=101924 RepID=A0AAV8UIN6_9RHOD|nr:hypothetical protein NDN08_004889 [Rhodosorus marinus]